MRREGSQQSSRANLQDKIPVQQPGTLFIVGVPIGHPDDITLRALRILRHADIVVSESPAATQALLQYHGLSAILTSYGPGHLKEKVSLLIDRLRRGTHVALVSDCGSPVISDPGCLLINAAHRQHIPVRSVPGPSAVTAAIAASGWSGDSFFFQGQIPDGTMQQKRWLAATLKHTVPSIFFCSSESLTGVIETLARLNKRRQITAAYDLTTSREMIQRGTAPQILKLINEMNPPSAVTIILEGRRARRKRTTAARKKTSS
ncbi:16S rRNA (cytidine(1402)-2'-O)-methyltransferase [Nitrospira sp. NS4]|uniref:16S rRNA (cytidine(1402)-2'-O)-methyltransferase n=1 Tax=Nitrospira sp. NS4 TaxID=3414498 RepID=UPI003C2E9B52